MKRHIIIPFILISLMFLSFASLSHAVLAGKISTLEGRVDVLKSGKNTVTPVKAGDPVDVGDIYRAKSDGKAEITFLNNNILKIAPTSRVEIKEAMFEGDKTSNVVKLHRGRVQAISSDEFIKKVSAFAEGNRFEVHTTNAIAGIRGSNMVVSFIRGITSTLFITGNGYQFNPADPQKRVVTITGGNISFVPTITGPPTPSRRATTSEINIQVNAVTTIASLGSGSGTSSGAGSGTALGTATSAIATQAITQIAGSPDAAAAVALQLAPALELVLPTILAPPPPEPPTPTPASTYLKSDFSTPLWYYATHSVSSTLIGAVSSPISLVLTWGATPRDLDAHAFIPQSGSYYTVYYANRGSLTSFPYAYLDRDVTSGYGPETITIQQFTNGASYYSVYNWSGSPAISTSGAVVVVKDAGGNIIATYNVPTTGTESAYWWNVLSLQASSSTSANLYTINSIGYDDPVTTSWQSSGIINATMAGTGALWTQGTRVPTTVTGQYTGGGGGYGKIASAILYSQNIYNTNKTTNDGGAYYGVFSGTEVDNNITTKVMNVYIDPSGNAGYITGSLTGTVNTDSDIFAVSGPIYSTKITSGTGIQPADLYVNMTYYNYPSDIASGSGSFTAGGTLSDFAIRDSLYQRNIVNQYWGIWDTQLGAIYSGTTGNNWSASISTDVIDSYTYRINRLEITGTQWSDKNLAGTIYGYGGDASYTSNALTGKTWINVGETVGSFNPSSLTSQAILTGVWIETNKFLDLVATNQASLQQLNIPCVAVGSANLSGSGNNMTVSMNNVVFFSNSAGDTPKIWATGNVNGGYTGTPSTYVPVALSGSGLSADFNVKQWNTSSGKWLATVTNGTGSLSGGSYAGAVTFKGVGAGAINQTANTFSGTAAGTAK